jgi:ketosteroid isomerase-like protein
MVATMTQTTNQRPSFAERLCAATNSHDIDRVVDCFTEDYVNETPVHPERGFRGRDQVRRNWTQIFASVPDITAEVIRSDQVGDTVWAEGEMRGTRLDGGEHLMRGVMVFSLDEDRARALRFYLEPVDRSGLDADQAVQQILVPPQS